MIERGKRLHPQRILIQKPTTTPTKVEGLILRRPRIIRSQVGSPEPSTRRR